MNLPLKDWRLSEGPWNGEPDRVEFEHAGLPCLLKRNGDMGNWCAYAAVLPGHPLHGKHHYDPDVDVHGGLTYSGPCSGGICHVPRPGEPDDVWWFGFDCGHASDVVPWMALNHGQLYSDALAFLGMAPVYRDVNYVRAETERLAAQLAKVKP